MRYNQCKTFWFITSCQLVINETDVILVVDAMGGFDSISPVALGSHSSIPQSPQRQVEVQYEGTAGNPLTPGEAAVSGALPQRQPQVALHQPKHQLRGEDPTKPSELLWTCSRCGTFRQADIYLQMKVDRHFAVWDNGEILNVVKMRVWSNM